TKPIQSQSKPIKANPKPIKANNMPKQTQFKPKQTQFQSQYMPRMKINPRRLFAIPDPLWITGGRICRYQKPHFVIDFSVFHPILLYFAPFCVSLSLEISLNLCDNYCLFNLLFLLEVCF
ncbi:MAG: hypothetical protein OEW48_05865, partial [Phycisphaerae bacterium]|nr:hypothetical protein [Phycisphaerae bacterium]